MAGPFISIVVHAIREVVAEEDQFHNGVRTQAKELLPKLENLITQLASSVESNRKLKERMIKDFAYRAQEVLEKYFVKIKTRSGIIKESQRRLSCIQNEACSSRHEVEKELREINNKLAQLINNFSTSTVNNHASTTLAPITVITPPPNTAPQVDVIVGASTTTTSPATTPTAPPPATTAPPVTTTVITNAHHVPPVVISTTTTITTHSLNTTLTPHFPVLQPSDPLPTITTTTTTFTPTPALLDTTTLAPRAPLLTATTITSTSTSTTTISPAAAATDIASTSALAPPTDDDCFVNLDKDAFVGKKRDIIELVSLLKDENIGQIISLYGMCGSGKTAMAKAVLKHPDITNHFECFALVPVTQKCEHTTILKDLFDQLTSSTSQQWKTHTEYLVDILEVSKTRKCLVVLDDVWTTTDREIIRQAFPNTDGNKSKILLTTQIEEIASGGVIYHQRLLNLDDGLDLLIQRIRMKRPDLSIGKSLQLLGKEMVRRCGGVPLAISILGDILASQLSVKEWKMINKDIGFTLNQGSDSEVASKALGLSYHDLPHYLKPCFLYMGLFGNHENIELRKLYHVWIAEGLVLEEHRKGDEATLMDVAERFLKELSSRCMAHVQKDLILERVESCRLYDHMKGYCLRMAKEERFLHSVDMDLRGGQIEGVDTLVDDNAQRLAIHMIIDPRDARSVKPLDLIRNNHLRALSFRCVKPIHHQSTSSNLPFFSMGKYKVKASLTSYFKLLKVLDFVDCRFDGKKLPNGMGELVLLRFLGLRGCNIEELPTSVGEIPLLQTLDLRTCSTIKILAGNIFSKMKKLRHLYLSNFKCLSGEELQLNGLPQLETLVFEKDIYKLKVSGLSCLTNIRYFKVNMLWNCNEWVSVIDAMQKWTVVKHLQVGISMVEGETIRKSLESNNISDLRLYRISSFMEFPPATNSSTNLVNLDIILCEGVNDSLIKLVGEFPNLRKLRCSGIKGSLREIKFDKNSFPQLRSIELNDVVELEKVKLEIRSLSNLITFRVGGCGKLEIEPEDGLRFIRMLRELEVNKNMSAFKGKCLEHHLKYPHVSIKDF